MLRKKIEYKMLCNYVPIISDIILINSKIDIINIAEKNRI